MAKKKGGKKRYSRSRAWLALNQRLSEHWRLAIFKLREQLEDDCLSHPPERRHLQNRRLIANLHAEFGQSGNTLRSAVMAYVFFCSSPWQDEPGYTEALRQHYAELKALGISPEFGHPQFKTKPKSAAFLIELLFRLDSLASWIEAQESWVFWTGLGSEPAAWDRNDAEARSQVMDALFVARLPNGFDDLADRVIAGMLEPLRKWTKPQWVKILKTAARIAQRDEQPVSEINRWVWWRYPVFMRYHWSAGEVSRAAEAKFGDLDELQNVPSFQAAWVRRGLRFTGKKTKEKRPQLWEFVINEPVPKNVSFKLPMLVFVPYENSSAQT